MTSDKDKAYDILCEAIDNFRELSLNHSDLHELEDDFHELLDKNIVPDCI